MTPPGDDRSSLQDDTLPNRFAGLDIYQPSAAFLAAPDIQRPTKPDADPVDYVAEISTSLEDTITTLWMLMDDMNTARAFLQSIWKNASNSTVLLTADEVQRIIELCAYETSTDEETGQTLLCQIEDEKKVREKKKLRHEFESGSKLSKSGRGEPRVSFSVMMDLLVNALQAETVEFPFPYVMMHRRCWQLFRHVRDACEPQLRQLLGPNYLETESQHSRAISFYRHARPKTTLPTWGR